MTHKVAGAPITWGVCEVPGWGYQLDRDRVLSEIAAAGLRATELGPRGFLPEDPTELSELLRRHGLSLVAGFVPAILHRADILAEQLTRVHETAKTLAGAGAEVLVLAADSGDVGYDASFEMSDDEWNTLRTGISAVEAIGADVNLTVAVHPHYGTLIARERDVRRLLDGTSAKLCLDTGHLLVGGTDPLSIANDAADRIALVHLKDVDAVMAGQVRSGTLGYRDAVSRGLYRPLGDGDANIAELVRVLSQASYDGWYVIEQDLVIPEGGNGDEPLRNAKQSVAYLERATA